MRIGYPIEYKHLWSGQRPDPMTFLKNIPSKTLISIICIIQETLRNFDLNEQRKLNPSLMNVQHYLWENTSRNFDLIQKNRIWQIVQHPITHGYELFTTQTCMALLNQIFLNYDDNIVLSHNSGEIELKIFKAFISMNTEIAETDALDMQSILTETKEEGGFNLIKLMWPHLLSQYEFIATPHLPYEAHKGIAFIKFIENHSKFSATISEYFRILGCNNGEEYISKYLSIIMPHETKPTPKNPNDYFYTIKLTQADPVINNLVFSIPEYQSCPENSHNYKGIRQKPLFELETNRYIVLNWDYLINALFSGLLFSFYYDTDIRRIYENAPKIHGKQQDFTNFKSEISKDFTENVIFKRTVEDAFSNSASTLFFPSSDSAINPDCYYRRNNCLFLIEFKDALMSSQVIKSRSYEKMESELVVKFVGTEKSKKGKSRNSNKGVYQLAQNIENLVNSKNLFYKIDKNAEADNLQLSDLIIYPVIIQTSTYFDLPAMNDFLDEKFQNRIKTISDSFSSIEPLTLIHINDFLDRLILFQDGILKFEEEISFYQQELIRRKKNAINKGDIGLWMDGLLPFGKIRSPQFAQYYLYRRNELIPMLRNIWNK